MISKSTLLGILFFGFPLYAAPAKPVCQTLRAAVASGSASVKLKKFLDEQWKNSMAEFPEVATDVGYPGQNDRWTDQSLEAIARREKDNVCQLQILKTIPGKNLSAEEAVTRDLAIDRLQQDIEAAKFGGKYLVLDHLWGLQMAIVSTLSNMPRATVKDYDNIIARLEAIPTLVEQNKILLRAGLKRNITPVRMLLAPIPGQFDQVLKEKKEDSPLYLAFKEIPASIGLAQRDRLQKRALEVLNQKTYPALEDLKKFAVEEYIPRAREGVSISEMPEGKAWYAFLVKSHTTTNRTPEDLHALGLSEVARIGKLMEEQRARTKFAGDLKSFNEFLLKDPQFYYTKKEDLLIGYRDIAKRLDSELPRFFKNLPRLTYGVREMPEYQAKDSPAAYYEGGSLEAGRSAFFTANTYDLKARPKWAMEVLTSHEAVPGHHLQISLAREIRDLPEFRKNSGYTAFVEGWGLYAESLAEEMGFYKDAYAKFGQLSFEMWRAVRLVIDTGIHEKGWTREKAVAYFLAHLPKSQLEAEVEVDRYITWPGQALAYKVGQLKFLELRERSKAQLGERFDIREFHDQALKHGAVPLNILEKNINEWIASKNKT